MIARRVFVCLMISSNTLRADSPFRLCHDNIFIEDDLYLVDSKEMDASAKPENLVLEAPAARLLALAERRIGELEAIQRLWQPWPGFASGALTAWFSLGEIEMRGLTLDLAELISLGPNPQPSRPTKPLRLAVGLILTRGRLYAEPSEHPLVPSLVTELYQNLDAPGLARGASPPKPLDAPVPGAAAWTLAPRWLKAGLPPLWAAGLALAAWEREGPQARRRSRAGRIFLCGLAPRLGLPAHAFDRVGPGMLQAAISLPGGLDSLMKEVRDAGAWRKLFLVFLSAMEFSARSVCGIAMAARELNQSHHDLIDTWVRAPQNPKRLLDLLLAMPVIDLPTIAEKLDVTQRTAGLLVDKLADQALLAEITGQKRGRRFAYAPLMQLLQPGWGEEEETEPA